MRKCGFVNQKILGCSQLSTSYYKIKFLSINGVKFVNLQSCPVKVHDKAYLLPKIHIKYQ